MKLLPQRSPKPKGIWRQGEEAHPHSSLLQGRAFLPLLLAFGSILWLLLASSNRSQAEPQLLPAPQLQFTYKLYFPRVDNSPLIPPYDMTTFMIGDGRLYEVQHSIGSQARHQTQRDSTNFYHTKGDEIKAEWEELWATNQHILRGTDTSPGGGNYYTLRENGQYGSAWSPRRWNVGDLFEREPLVTFYRKSDCGIVANGTQRSWLKFEAFYPQYTFDSGLRLYNVIQLAWLEQPGTAPIERYIYAEHYGLVGWSSSNNGSSYISEIHAPGQRPDNTREVISCLDRSGHLPASILEEEIGPLPPPYRAK